MKQIQLKIEEFFGVKGIVWEFKTNLPEETGLPIIENIEGIILSKVLVNNPFGGYIPEPSESRETIMDALWELQKDILPTGWGWDDEGFEIKRLGALEWYDKLFYNPETRIITITDFKE